MLAFSPAALAQIVDIGPPDGTAPETVIAVEPAPEESGPVELQLAVTYNGKDLGMIAAFVQGKDGKISSKRAELAALGLPVEADGKPEDMLALDSIKGITYVYDEAMQAIKIELDPALRPLNKLNASGREYVKAESGGSGLVVNYSSFGAATYYLDNRPATFDSASLYLDARAYAEIGALRQTASISTIDFSEFTTIRQDTTYSYSDQDKARSYRAGDITTGGLGWTRSLKLGGAQVQRNFRLRPDLATVPLPLIEGTVDTPSTLKVFVGGSLIYSTELQPGPYRLDNLPFYSAGGNIRVVLVDASGRETSRELLFYSAPTLLQKNLYDYSFDLGVLRREVGVDPFAYDDAPVALGSVRYGFSDSFTGEAHGELDQDLVNLGLGGVWSLGEFGIFNAAAAGSLFEGGRAGAFLQAGWDADFGNLSLNAGTSRTFGEYFDLASATAEAAPPASLQPTTPRAVDRISASLALPSIKAGVSGGFVHSLSADGARSLSVNGNWSQSLPHGINAYVSGNYEFGDVPGWGVFLGASMPLGERVTATTNYTKTDDNWNWVNEVYRSNDGQPGSHGWRVAHGEGENRFNSAAANYVGSKARIDGRLHHQYDAKTVNANVVVDGAVVAAGGGLFLSNQIYDSFAIVDAGAKDVEIKYENRVIGKTGKNGKLLVPGLRSYDGNKIEIDANDLPVTALSPETEKYAVPREFSGVVIDFGVKTESKSALVTIMDAAGKLIDAGTEVMLAGAEEPFIMGYDGQVFLEGLAASNTVTVKAAAGECKASFAYKQDPVNITTIGPVTCQ